MGSRLGRSIEARYSFRPEYLTPMSRNSIPTFDQRDVQLARQLASEETRKLFESQREAEVQLKHPNFLLTGKTQKARARKKR